MEGMRFARLENDNLPRKGTAVVQIEHLVRVEEFAKVGYQVKSLAATGLYIYKNK